MTRLRALLAGEVTRLNKYRLVAANVALLLAWLLLASFLGTSDLKPFIVFIFLMDAVMTNIALVGVTMFYERQEHTISSILVSPVTDDEYLLSKVVAGILSSMLTVFVIAVGMWLIKGVTLYYVSLIPAVIVVAVFHSLLGIALTYGAKDFTGIMLRGILYMFVFLLPAVFGLFGLIGSAALNYLIILPTESSAQLISTSIGTVDGWKVLFSYIYLLLLSVLMYAWVVKPGFRRRLVREVAV
jgi:fluoroquinolone transport system permease protein